MIILAVESSCDETSIAIVKDGREVLSNIINSQIDIHKVYGGVVPEIASRRHIEVIDYVADEAMKEAKITKGDIDAVAVTYAPGLVGALLVGVSWAKAYSYALNVPLIPVHHIRAHICANFIEDKTLTPPFICLVASGGHSHIVCVQDYTEFEILARTRDDAAGEAFDKIARVIGLGYPGGPLIDKLAKEGNPNAIVFPEVRFKDGCLDFSFSGVKTATLNYLHKKEQKGEEINHADVAASFQKAVVNALVDHTIEAAKRKNITKIALAGGVAANSCLRETMKKGAKENRFSLHFPAPVLCTDNAAMVGCAGFYEYLKGTRADLSLNAIASKELK
jgi:putative glycoprotease GCP